MQTKTTFEQVNELYNERNYAKLAVLVKELGQRDMRDHWFRYQRDYAKGALDVMRGRIWGPRPVDVEPTPKEAMRGMSFSEAEMHYLMDHGANVATFGEYDARLFAISTMVEGERYRFERINPDPAPRMEIRDMETMSAERTIDAVYVGVRQDRAVFEDVTVYSAFVEATTGDEIEDVDFLSHTEIPLEILRANYRIVADVPAVSDAQLALV